jgi:hypothetical protein
MKHYALADLVKVTGVSVPTVKAWVRNDVIVPAIARGGKGQGRHRRVFDFLNLVEGVAVSRLHQAGVDSIPLLKSTVLGFRRALLELSGSKDERLQRQFDTWIRILNPRERQPQDVAFIVVTPHGARFTVGTAGSERFLAEMAVFSQMYVALTIVNLRAAVEGAEIETGDSWIGLVTAEATVGKRATNSRRVRKRR